MPTFILNDENVVNSYGFRVRNKGIDFKRFDENPVMLDGHKNDTASVMGRWKNRQIEGALLKMDTEFDEDLPEAKRLSGQVDRGFVKGASLGLAIPFDSYEDYYERQPDGTWDLIRCECMEGSPCGVPSNKAALCLYDTNTGEIISEEQIKLSIQKLSLAEIKTPNNPEMEKFNLSAPAMAVLVGFGLSNQNSEAEINAAVVALNAALTLEKGKAVILQTELDKQVKLQATAMVDLAITGEKLLAGEREDFIQLAVTNYDLASKLINARPAKQNLSSGLNNPVGGAEVKNIDDFEKLGTEKQLAYKTAHPDAYRALFAK